MQGDKDIITQLNRILRNELTAINQYFLHARMLKNWGFRAQAKKEFEESIDEMKHADELIERILFLEGLPNLQDLGRLSIGEDVLEVLKGDLALEIGARKDMIETVGLCELRNDYVSRQIAEKILTETEEHIDYLETQIALVDKIGLPNYLQTAMGEIAH